jgi:hypothetical protein
LLVGFHASFLRTKETYSAACIKMHLFSTK